MTGHVRGRGPGLLAMLPLYVALATAIGFVDFHVRPYRDYAYTTAVPEMLAGKADPPARYRVLAPRAYEALTRATGLPAADAWIVFRWLCLVATLLAGHFYFRTWFDTALTLAGNALVMALLPLTFTNSWGQPDHLSDLFLFTLGCACIARNHRKTFIVVLALAALNRETSAFLLPVFAFASPWSRAHAAWVAASVAVWVAITGALRWSLGWVPYEPWQWSRNLVFLGSFPAERDLYYRLYPWFFLALLVPLVLLIVWTWSRQPRFEKAAVGVAFPLLVVACVCFSSIIETRIFTPALPLLAPGVLFALDRRDYD